MHLLNPSKMKFKKKKKEERIIVSTQIIISLKLAINFIANF